jgi:phosphonate transport system substrate-binding protein
MHLNRRIAALLLIVLGLTAGCAPKPAGPPPPAPLLVGVIPFEQPDKIKVAYQPFADYLGKNAGGRPGKVFVTPDYAGVLQALQSGQIDVAYLNPLSYVVAAKQFASSPEHLIPMAMPWFHGSPTYKGIIFVRADSGINSVKDFKGKSFAFGDRTSTSGYLYPAGMMVEAGIDPNKDVKPANITGPAGVFAVLNHQADGGATFEGGIELALKNPKDRKQIKVIATTDPIPNGMFVARGDLDPATLAELQKAFDNMDTDPAGVAALKSMQYDKVVPANDSFFDSVRKKAAALDLQLGSLDKK